MQGTDKEGRLDVEGMQYSVEKNCSLQGTQSTDPDRMLRIGVRFPKSVKIGAHMCGGATVRALSRRLNFQEKESIPYRTNKVSRLLR